MTLAELLGIGVRMRVALLIGAAAALAAALLTFPIMIPKLRAARVIGHDRNKPDRPEVAEMGGLGIFVAFNSGVFLILAFGDMRPDQQTPIFASLVVAAGACITGIIDDLVVLRQAFKAFIPFVFAAPLALFLSQTSVAFPFVGEVGFGVLYPLVLVPLAIACGSNAFNILEGFNGLGAGIGIVMSAGLAMIAYINGNVWGIVLLLPLLASLIGFLWFNRYPARVFPGDTGTLFIGCVLAAGAILSRIEFWALLIFLPHIVEFALKARTRFRAQSFASRVVDGRLVHDGPILSLTHFFMRHGRHTESSLVFTMVAWEAAWVLLVVSLAYVAQPGTISF
jgi:UDP-N-acetylglucosamine--dolichyl-phosphate N-acetylglucosaminephosphotransferase